MNTELYHHGILGQKWGIRRYQNPDGTLTEAGRKRLVKSYEQITKKQDKTAGNTRAANKFYRANSDVIKEIDKTIMITNSANKAKDILQSYKDKAVDLNKKNEKIMNDYLADRERLGAVAATMECMRMDDKPTISDISKNIRMHIFEDGGQGDLSSNSVYLYEKGYSDKTVDSYKTNIEPLHKLNSDYKEQIENYVKEEFGNIGLNRIGTRGYADAQHYISTTIAHKVSDYGFDDKATVQLTTGLDGLSRWDTTDKNNYEIAKNVISKISDSNNTNTWYNLSKAVSNLGYENIPYDEITQSMWNKINAECRSLYK